MTAHMPVRSQPPARVRPASDFWARIDPIVHTTEARRRQAHAQAEALRAGRLDELDLENLAEEIADVSRREADALESHLETLVLHLLKWRHDPDHRSRN